MDFKDLFSTQASDYAKYRPHYPAALFRYLASITPAHQLAWDCGTGSGQAALMLADYFDTVVATDPSEKQLMNAERHAKVEYKVAPAEESPLKVGSVNLVTVAQAFHWFRQDIFFKEVRRVTKPGGILALWCYNLCQISPEIDKITHYFYEDILGPYWEKERRQIEEGYRNCPFPFEELSPPRILMTADWTVENLIGYLATWSSLQTYIKKHGTNPLDETAKQLRHAWGTEPTRAPRWELCLRIGRV